MLNRQEVTCERRIVMGSKGSKVSDSYRGGYRGEPHTPPNSDLDYTFASPVGKGPGTANQLNQENKDAKAAHDQGKADAKADAKKDDK
jgi:hypothetical protein